VGFDQQHPHAHKFLTPDTPPSGDDVPPLLLGSLPPTAVQPYAAYLRAKLEFLRDAPDVLTATFQVPPPRRALPAPRTHRPTASQSENTPGARPSLGGLWVFWGTVRPPGIVRPRMKGSDRRCRLWLFHRDSVKTCICNISMLLLKSAEITFHPNL